MESSGLRISLEAPVTQVGAAELDVSGDSMLRQGELDRMTHTATTGLPGTCDLISATLTPDDLGGLTEDWTTPTLQASGVATRYSEMLGMREQEQATRLELDVAAKMVFPAHQPIAVGWRATNVIVDGVDLGTYEVVGFITRSWETARSVFVGRISAT